MAPQPGIVGFIVLYNQLRYIFHQQFVHGVLKKFLVFTNKTKKERSTRENYFTVV